VYPQEYDFKNMHFKEEFHLEEGICDSSSVVYVSIYTDGCTKILRFSDRGFTDKRREDDFIHSNLDQEVKVMKTTI
jgi:hypothetical protein